MTWYWLEHPLITCHQLVLWLPVLVIANDCICPWCSLIPFIDNKEVCLFKMVIHPKFKRAFTCEALENISWSWYSAIGGVESDMLLDSVFVFGSPLQWQSSLVPDCALGSGLQLIHGRVLCRHVCQLHGRRVMQWLPRPISVCRGRLSQVGFWHVSSTGRSVFDLSVHDSVDHLQLGFWLVGWSYRYSYLALLMFHCSVNDFYIILIVGHHCSLVAVQVRSTNWYWDSLVM